jgi:2-dehydro-3-deoxygluconokinase
VTDHPRAPHRAQATPRVVCLGETMLMFAPPPYELIERCDHFTAYSGGSESNVAIGVQRLGLHAGWIGKLPDNALGHKVVNEIRRYGVDTSACIWADQGRVGTFYVEWGAPPRPLKTIYDRAGSAATTLTVDDLDWDYLAGAEWLHLTGITPAISDACRESVRRIAARARESGCKVSFDVNYRSLLWTPDKARAALQEVLPYVNLLVATRADAALLLGLDGEAASPSSSVFGAQLARRLYERHRPDAAVITCSDEGCVAYDGEALYRSPGYDVQVVNRLGAGDAFDAGLLYGYLASGLQAGLDYGCAMAALKLTVPQNTPLIDRKDVERLLAGRNLDVVR